MAHPARCTFVIDTSVLLSDPHAFTKFAEHQVVLPIVVITELEAKRSHPELGYFARAALHALDELRIRHRGLSDAVPANAEGGTVRIELNHSETGVLPAGFRLGDNDTRILTVAANLAAEHTDRRVVVVSKDLPMRVKASAIGLDAQEYRAQDVIDTGWTGVTELEVPADYINALHKGEQVDLEDLLASWDGSAVAPPEQPVNTG